MNRQNPQTRVGYSQMYRVQAGRVTFANYTGQLTQVINGIRVGANLYPPTNDEGIMPILQTGVMNTTPVEFEGYKQTALEGHGVRATIPDAVSEN